MFRMKLWSVMILGSVMMLGVCGGCNGKKAKEAREATITVWDVENDAGSVKLKIDGREETFKLAEDIEYIDGAGNVAVADVFTSGDTVLIVEREGTIIKMTKKSKTESATPSKERDNNVNEAMTTDDFLQTADQIDMAEVKIGNLAREHAASNVVKKFAERMVSDHSQMNDELREIASKKGFTLDKSLDAKHQALFDQLSSLTGVEFDHAYTKDMVAGHQQAVARFESQANSGSDPDVKAWAEKWLPTLREHLTLAQQAVMDIQGEIDI